MVRANSILTSKIGKKIHSEFELGPIYSKQGSSSLSNRALASCESFLEKKFTSYTMLCCVIKTEFSLKNGILFYYILEYDIFYDNIHIFMHY